MMLRPEHDGGPGRQCPISGAGLLGEPEQLGDSESPEVQGSFRLIASEAQFSHYACQSRGQEPVFAACVTSVQILLVLPAAVTVLFLARQVSRVNLKSQATNDRQSCGVPVSSCPCL